MDKLERLIESLDEVPGISIGRELEREVEAARGIREWAISKLRVEVGQHVRIADNYAPIGDYKRIECLHGGATAVVKKIFWNEFQSRWYALVELDDEYYISSQTGKKKSVRNKHLYTMAPSDLHPIGA